jgi:hypothetical protein
MSEDIPDIDPNYIHGKLDTPSGTIAGRGSIMDVEPARPDESRWPRNRNELDRWTSFFESILQAGRPADQAAYDADKALSEWRLRRPGVKQMNDEDDPLSSEGGEDRSPKKEPIDPDDPLF